MLWRWHFYAGIFCVPFVLALGISGGIYLFKPQIDHVTAQSRQNLASSESHQAPSAHADAALAAVPGADLDFYELPSVDNQAVTVGLQHEGQGVLVYVNPFTLEVLDTEFGDQRFIRLVRAFHGELLMGRFGSVLVELAACWTIVLVATGLFLWWPRGSRGLAGVFYPRLRQSNRISWRDLHAVIGFWIAGFTLFLLISGLPWALVWGAAFKDVRERMEPQLQQDWTVSEHQHHHGAAPSVDNAHLSSELVSAAQSLDFAAPAVLSPSVDEMGVWTLKSQHQNRPLRAEAWLEGESGAVLRVQRFADRPLIDRIIGMAIAAHEGQLFGWLNQALGLFTAAGLVTLSLSGCIMWWKRRPAGVLGAPPSIPHPNAARVVAIVVLLSAALLPLLLISLVLIAALEWLLLRRVPVVRDWLGVSTTD